MRQPFRKQRPEAGHLYLLLVGISSALIYGALLVRFPLLELYQIPLQNLNHLKLAEWPKGLLMIGCIMFLFGGYSLGAFGLAITRPRRMTLLLLIGFPLLFVALLLLVQPVTSTDLYDYLFRGRMLARYRVNPFVAIPGQFPHDPLLKYVAWKQVVTAYGPLWERLSWLTARLAGQAPGAPDGPAALVLLRLLLAYKGLVVLGFLLCGGAIWAALKHVAPEQRWLGLYLWLWNPLVLWEAVGNGHNDVWMALGIVLAVWAMGWRHTDTRTSRQAEQAPQSPPLPISLSPYLLAFLALTAGGLIKFMAFFFGPVVLAASLRRLPTWRARARLFVIGGAAFLITLVASYVPFWAGWETLRNIGDRRSLFTATWLAALQARLKLVIPEDQAGAIVAWIGLGLLLAGVAWAAWRAWRAPEDLPKHMLWLVLWFLFVANPWFQPWYVIWPLALVALQPWRTRAVLAVNLFCVMALIGYVVGGFLPALGLDERSAVREILMSVFLYVPPLLVFGWGRLTRPVLRWRGPRSSGEQRQAAVTAQE
jgi:hypothetical protein